MAHLARSRIPRSRWQSAGPRGPQALTSQPSHEPEFPQPNPPVPSTPTLDEITICAGEGASVECWDTADGRVCRCVWAAAASGLSLLVRRNRIRPPRVRRKVRRRRSKAKKSRAVPHRTAPPARRRRN